MRRVAGYLLHGVPNINVTAAISYSSPEATLSSKKIIITGGGRGLGYAMAKKFASEGAEVLITGRNEETLSSAAEEIGCRYLVFDVNDFESIPKFIEKVDEILDGANVLVNNAGVSLHEPTFFDVTPETFDRQISTNLKAPFFLTQSFIRHIVSKNQQGVILFVSSEVGETVDFRPYGYSKAAINSMIKGLAYLFKNKGIRINGIAPGITASDMTGIKAADNLYAGEYGSGRFYLPEEVAEIASFLISDNSACIGGQIVTCNNGDTINARWR